MTYSSELQLLVAHIMQHSKRGLSLISGGVAKIPTLYAYYARPPQMKKKKNRGINHDQLSLHFYSSNPPLQPRPS